MESCGRSLVIGLDGASWNVLDPLIEGGHMPALAGLREGGAWGILESTIPFYTGPAWASFVTGCSPARHGVYDFMLLRPDAGLTIATRADLREPTYYDSLSADGRRSVIVNLPLDQPETPSAVIVNSWLTPDSSRRMYPLERQKDYQAELAAYRNYPSTFEAPLGEHVDDLCGLEQARFDLVRALFRREPWDHFYVLFSAPDWLGHRATGSFLAGAPDARAAFERLYRQLDGYIRWLVDHSGDALTIVLSDHGQCEECYMVHVNGMLREMGLVNLMGERRAVRVPKGARRIPASIARPLARVARRWFTSAGAELITPRLAMDVDRSASRAFTPTVASYGVHVRGAGEAVVREIAEGLTAIRLPDGRPAFDGVWTHEQQYGSPPSVGAPAILFAPAQGVRPSIEVKSPLVERVPRPGRGAHKRDGMLVLHGPGVLGQELPRVSLLQLAPTILWTMGAGIPAGCEGTILTGAFESTSDYPPARVFAQAPVQPADPYSDAERAEVARRLGDLGYL